MDKRRNTRWVALSGLVATLTAVGALLRVPMWPVPITFQTFFVLLGGGVLPVAYAAAAQLSYLACGMMGLPVFASGGGLGAALQPTFGYIVAFPLASAAVSWFIRRATRREDVLRPPSWHRLLLVNAVGILIVLLLGVSYLYFNLNVVAGGHISLGTALWSGAIIFLPGELAKTVLAAAIVRRVWTVVQR